MSGHHSPLIMAFVACATQPQTVWQHARVRDCQSSRRVFPPSFPLKRQITTAEGSSSILGTFDCFLANPGRISRIKKHKIKWVYFETRVQRHTDTRPVSVCYRGLLRFQGFWRTFVAWHSEDLSEVFSGGWSRHLWLGRAVLIQKCPRGYKSQPWGCWRLRVWISILANLPVFPPSWTEAGGCLTRGYQAHSRILAEQQRAFWILDLTKGV